ncbi:unnamed protein product [Echinostoma caproni]|uniref:DUF5641 domain-containing protein n=1 Tax=Echinostoma caproni TaxID=27848 RepID=A0A183A174_9TREM|nr:unnamed protein product [Echinostoma caproni]
MAWQRFVGRRGNPSNVFSDNGSKFVGAQKELNNWLTRLDKCALQDRLSPSGIQWHFSPPYSGHNNNNGAIFHNESREAPNDETLSTFLAEAERILNNRPLVPFTSDDLQGLTLTPIDLLLLRSNDGLDMPKNISGCYTSGWKHANYLARVFWKRWTREYLPTLQARQKWLHSEQSLKVEDVVLMAEEKLQRDNWPLGVVIESHSDSDGLVRTVKLKTSASEQVRDIQRVCLLEGDDHYAVT